MSLDVKLITDTEQQQPRSTPAGLVGSETAVTYFDPTSVFDDEGYRSFLGECVDPENL
jgi:hypothetical protein